LYVISSAIKPLSVKAGIIFTASNTATVVLVIPVPDVLPDVLPDAPDAPKLSPDFRALM
jgi:hypothetical protein